MIVEWSHRSLAAMAGVLALATAVSAWRRHRHDLVVPVLATAAVVTMAL
jgi:heme A synthase